MCSVTLQSAGVVDYRARVGKTRSLSRDPSTWRARSCSQELPGDGGARGDWGCSSHRMRQ